MERRPTIFETSDLVPSIRAWLARTREIGLPNGPAPEEVSLRAIRLVERLRRETLKPIVSALEPDSDVPDVLHAMIEIHEQNRDLASKANLLDLGRAYELVSDIAWEDEFSERTEMLARLSFLAWNQCRLLDDYPSARMWQSRCAEHTLSQEHVRNFISLRFAERSRELTERFLRDEPVLLTACDRLERERNRVPAEVAVEGEALYGWLDEFALTRDSDSELNHYLAASVAVSVGGARNHLYDRLDDKWADRAQLHIEKCNGSAPLAAVLEHLRLSSLYQRYKSSTEVAEACERLIRRLESLGMAEGACRTRYLLGVVWQELGEYDRASRYLMMARTDATGLGDSIVASLALSTNAQILGVRGHMIDGLSAGKEALEVAVAAGCEWAVGYAQGSIGELLRDSGRLEESIDAYATALRSYEKAEHPARIAYMRVVLAEALLIADRSAEAASEILAALPLLEENKLGREGVAALALLREALQRQQADPVALRQLREQLQLLHIKGKL